MMTIMTVLHFEKLEAVEFWQKKKYHYHYRIHKDAKQVFRQMENNSLMINRFYGQSV